MFRTSIVKAVRPANRAFSTTAKAMIGADSGAPLGGSQPQGDQLNKREKASEDYEIRKREHEKLLELKKKLAEQHTYLNNLEKSIDEITKSSEKK